MQNKKLSKRGFFGLIPLTIKKQIEVTIFVDKLTDHDS